MCYHQLRSLSEQGGVCVKKSFSVFWTLLVVLPLITACGHGRPVAPAAPAPPPPAPKDATDLLIDGAERHLATGTQLAANGHLNQAREEFDKAVEVYLTAPGGAYGETRLADAYRRTLEAIHTRELEALAAGDGFTETTPEPASIDELGELALGEEPVSEETRRVAQEVARDEHNDLDIDLNDPVVGCIELYQGRLREWFTAALARGGRYLPKIREVFKAEGIPQDLAYVALVESAFKTSAFSRAKARGVWQFISATGKRYGLKQDWWIDERSNPDKATHAAAKYLKELHDLFGDWNLALAGYNAGEGKVLRGINKYGTSDYWKLRQTRALLRETKNYVPMIHAAIIVAKAPEKYGFVVEPESPVVFETVPVKYAVDLRTVSECADTTLDTVQQLNPELRRLATPDRSFDLNVPVGKGSSLVACLEKIPVGQRVRFRTHVVGRGQTLASISRRYGVRSADIAQANGLSAKKRLGRGTELIIPIEYTGAAPARRSSAVVHARAEVPAGTPAAPSQPVRVSYRVKPGDTLVSIASQYGTTVRELRSWNRLRGSQIVAGAKLTIYTHQ
jgi:membrane-bound lytic murein transglycosylase D